MEYLTFKFEKVINHKYLDRLEIKVDEGGYRDYVYWFRKCDKEPILKYKEQLYLFYFVNKYEKSFSFIPLKNQGYVANMDLTDNELVFYPSSIFRDEIKDCNTQHNYSCDVCELCFECNDGVSYYNDNDHPNTLINYEKKYNVKVDRVCEYCMDDECISDKDAQN